MIDSGLVTNAVLERLRLAWLAVGDGQAPPGATGAYGVLDLAAGTISDGDMDQPERDIHLRYRVTAVATDRKGAQPSEGLRVQAEHLAWRLRQAMLDRATTIEGFGWSVQGRTHVANAGAIREGATVNVVDDYELWVVEVAV